MSPQWEYWKAAMQEEQNSLDPHKVMEIVPRPHRHKVIRVHWIFSDKTDAHGNVLTFKAGSPGMPSDSWGRCRGGVCPYKHAWVKEGTVSRGC
jgi:hypothetical protein